MIQKLDHQNIDLPDISINLPKKETYELFDLSSHERAKTALEFGLNIHRPEFNIFVIGQNRSGRLSAILALSKKHLSQQAAVPEWVYLHNFEKPEEPLPFPFPSRKARAFALALEKAAYKFIEKYDHILGTSSFATKVQTANKRFKQYIELEIEKIRSFSVPHHFDIHWGTDGTITPVYLKEHEDPEFKQVPQHIWDSIIEKLQDLDQRAEDKQTELNKKLQKMKITMAQNGLVPLLDKIKSQFEEVAGLSTWLNSFQNDILEHLHVFESDDRELKAEYLARCSVNVLVDSENQDHPPLIVEPNPSYENLFGQILYEAHPQGSYYTDHRMIRAGSLHKANGGILILRAESIAENPDSWGYLKAALRDKEIRIEEPHRMQGTPMLKAPRPQPIPLDVKIILIGAPVWYQAFFMNDPDFQTYFKIKAEINDTMDLTEENANIAAFLLQKSCRQQYQKNCTPAALSRILSYGSRLVEHRKKLSSQFERLQDIIHQAVVLSDQNQHASLTVEDVKRTINEMEKRHQGPHETSLELVQNEVIRIQTKGTAIGQINGLMVISGGDFVYGTAGRITATTSMGSQGVINVERQTKMGGPLQQKSVFIIEGFLRQRFAQKFPLNVSATLAFEQSYSFIDGDSASLAEMCALLSSLADYPLHQGIAITGSMNQLGEAQAIGGAIHKIEGFYDICRQNGLNGQQGVIIPRSNMDHLILKDELVHDVKNGQFHLWAVDTVEEAFLILTSPHIPDIQDKEHLNTLFERISKKLELFAKQAHP